MPSEITEREMGLLKLCQLYEGYISFLDYHISNVSGIAVIHGYKFDPSAIESGIFQRSLIDDLKSKINYEDFKTILNHG